MKEISINGNDTKIFLFEGMTKAIVGNFFDIKDGNFIDRLAFAKMEQLKDSMIINKSPEEKYVVTAFVSPTCTHCQELHKNIMIWGSLFVI